MSPKVKIKNDFEIFRKELEILYNRYLNNELSYLKIERKNKNSCRQTQGHSF